jgi:hypothetical protein
MNLINLAYWNNFNQTSLTLTLSSDEIKALDEITAPFARRRTSWSKSVLNIYYLPFVQQESISPTNCHCSAIVAALWTCEHYCRRNNAHCPTPIVPAHGGSTEVCATGFRRSCAGGIECGCVRQCFPILCG